MSSGKIVETLSGRGKTKNTDKIQVTKTGRKLIVYLDNGNKILCDPKNVKPIGFYD